MTAVAEAVAITARTVSSIRDSSKGGDNSSSGSVSKTGSGSSSSSSNSISSGRNSSSSRSGSIIGENSSDSTRITCSGSVSRRNGNSTDSTVVQKLFGESNAFGLKEKNKKLIKMLKIIDWKVIIY